MAIFQNIANQYACTGRGSPTYIDQLRDDTDLLTIDEINTAMNDREGWKKYVMD